MNPSYKIIFAGTPHFAVNTLNALYHSSHSIVGVYTQPDRPKGRGRHIAASPVKEFALAHDLPLFQPSSLRDAAEQNTLSELSADFMVVVAYGLILPLPILQAPRFGCLNVHASLLPRWRGAAPIQRAILAGDTETGVTIMQMNTGLDTGDILLTAECAIQATDTSETLHDRLANLGADALTKTLLRYTQLTPTPQNNTLATYAQKISKEEAKLDWQTSAVELARQIRAFNPWPVAFARTEKATVRIWEAIVLEQHSPTSPGTMIQISPAGIDVSTAQGILRLQKIQLPGGKRITIHDLLNAHHTDFQIGKKFQ